MMASPNSNPVSHRARRKPSLAAHALPAAVYGVTALGLVLGCGGSSEGDDGDVPSFGIGSVGAGGNNAAGAGGSSPLGGVAGSPALGGAAGAPTGTAGASGCVGANCEAPPPTTVATSCTPNTVSCQGDAIATCDATGTSATTAPCPAGSTCSTASGIPACQALPPDLCEANSTFCSTANVIGRCNAEGNAFTEERCPQGTNCSGAGECVPVSCNQEAMLSVNGGGGVTVYWFAQGTLSSPPQPNQDVNCSFGATRAPNDDGGQNDRVAFIQDPALFGAMNGAQYAGGASCGACVEVRGPAGTAVITVADSCAVELGNPTCTNGHIDLSRAAFQQVTGQNTGDINGISWRFVPCDGVDNVQFVLKEPNNAYWNEFLVINTRYPIVRAEVLMEDPNGGSSADGRWVDAIRQSYNYWRPSEGAPDGDMGTYRVRVTDVNGSIIEEQLELVAGPQGGSGQFGCQ